jgi:hypothetical protein
VKRILFFFFLQVICKFGYSQDTTDLFKWYDRTLSFKLITEKDTLLIFKYPDGKRESIRTYKKSQITGTYSRWYENGKLMWKKELKNGIQYGTSVFYSESGTKVAELMYENGKITDTIFIKANIHLALGKITSSSTVYGGMEREDGGSNVSEYSGPYMNCSMYAIRLDSKSKPKLVSKFKSDLYGDFFIIVPPGEIGFYPVDIKIDSLGPGDFHIPEKIYSSGNEGWNMPEHLFVNKVSGILFIELHHYSVGYAP